MEELSGHFIKTESAENISHSSAISYHIYEKHATTCSLKRKYIFWAICKGGRPYNFISGLFFKVLEKAISQFQQDDKSLEVWVGHGI
jgi:hypothetical protein